MAEELVRHSPGAYSDIFENFSYLVLLNHKNEMESCRVMVWGESLPKRKSRLAMSRAGSKQTW